jgi:hypothetical protein
MNEQEIKCIYCQKTHPINEACIRNEWHGECETTTTSYCKKCGEFVDQPQVCESCGKHFCDEDDHQPQPYSDVWLCVECIQDSGDGPGPNEYDIYVVVNAEEEVVSVGYTQNSAINGAEELLSGLKWLELVKWGMVIRKERWVRGEHLEEGGKDDGTENSL